MYDKSLEVVAAQEPWRQRIGHPEAVDDPLWSPDDAQLCDGTVVWEGKGSKHWVCEKCGYIGWCSLPAHRAPQNPTDMLKKSRQFFLTQRLEDNEAQAQAQLQADFVAAVALRIAARKNPAQLRKFIEELTRL